MVESTAQGESRRSRPHGLSRLLFVAFILFSVGLISMIWLENGRGEESNTPRFYRDTFVMDASAYATVTAEAASVEPVLAPTP